MNTSSRRNFLTKTALGGFAVAAIPNEVLAENNFEVKINDSTENQTFKPLSEVKISANQPCMIQVLDGNGRVYFRSSEPQTQFLFKAAGTLGNHTVITLDKKSNILKTLSFKLEAKTEINDSKGYYKELLEMLRWSLIGEWGENTTFRINNKNYTVFVPWIRDHTHTMKAMKYFDARLKDGFDLYADFQREDGMIWDNIYSRTKEANWWDTILEKGSFSKVIEDGKFEFKRQPVEADVEYLFVECLYYSWKANGDNIWMKNGLDKCIKALNYCMTDRYRWSKKYNLIKRGFTIDTWDFVHDYDLAQTGYGSGQCIDPDLNEFGVMHGDNTGFAVSCQYLAEMLRVANRNTEADFWEKKSKDILDTLNKLAWNNGYYTHYVPENNDFWSKRDIGNTKTNEQVSLSNAYAINRNIGHEKAVKIINTYQKIKNNLPKGSPGEWYTILPIFEKGFGNDNAAYEYMNGGVITIVAGELARGAFEHGYEDYGIDILKRLYEIGKSHDGYFNCTLKGAIEEAPKIEFTTINLNAIVNANFSGKSQNGEAPWTGEGYDNSMFNMPVGNQTFREIPFEISDPAKNNGKGCLILSNEKGYLPKAILPLNKKTKTIHLLHGRSKSDVFSLFTINYADGTSHTDYIHGDKSGNWWYPEDSQNWKVAFRISNNKSKNVGLGIYSFAHPFPEKEIKNIIFEAMKNNDGKWFVAGITLSDKAPYFKSNDISFGIPDRWGAAACVYGLFEGLVGVKDTGIAMNKVTISPRWAATNESKINSTIKYEASGGYVSYDFEKKDNLYQLQFTGNANQFDLEILLPKNQTVKSVTLNNKLIDFQLKKIENSDYLILKSTKIGANSLEIIFS